jgi:hypothetical protein
MQEVSFIFGYIDKRILVSDIFSDVSNVNELMIAFEYHNV